MTTSVSTTTLPLATGTWALDKNHSGIFFVVRHLGLSNVRGRFDRFDATLEVGRDLEAVCGDRGCRALVGRHQQPPTATPTCGAPTSSTPRTSRS